MIVHLIDGTYELFRQFYGNPARARDGPAPRRRRRRARTRWLQMLEGDATHVGVATDHVIESFRNELWPGYKTGRGDRAGAAGRSFTRSRRRSPRWASPSGRWSSSRPTTRWPPRRTWRPRDPRVEKVCIWTPDKDLAQCVVGDRVVQVDRKSGQIRDAPGVREKFGVEPALIPDYLALVGDAADGYPGIAGFGPKTAARLIARHGPLEDFPPEVLGQRRPEALLFKTLATLRTDAPLFDDVEALRWRGPTPSFRAR